MGLGDWRSPFPLRFGGNTHRLVDTFYKAMQASRPDMLTGGEGTEVDIENKAAARLLAMGWRATERRVAQRDPMKLSALATPVKFPDGTIESISMLERWERLLQIVPARGASDRARRAAVAGKLRGQTSTTLTAVTDAMISIFGSWFVSVSENSVDEVDYVGRATPGNVMAYWADSGFTFTDEYPGAYDADDSWTTGLAIIGIHFQPPAAVEQSLIDAKVRQANGILDDMLPAWMWGVVSQMASDAPDTGFFLDISSLDLTALLPMANSRAKSGGWSTNEKLTSAQANVMDVGQANALCRSGTTALTAATIINGGGFTFGFDMTDNAASSVGFSLGAQNLQIDCFGAGVVRMAANKLSLSGSSGWPILATRTLTNIAIPYTPCFNPAEWEFPAALPSVPTTLISTATTCSLLLGSLPAGLTLTGYRVDVIGATGGSLPGTMPTTSLYRFDAGAYFTPTETVGSQADTSANNAAYVVSHAITKTGLSHAVSASSQYILNLTSGFGGGAALGFGLYRVYISGTLATLQTV